MNDNLASLLLVEDDSTDLELFRYALGGVTSPPRLDWAKDGEEAIAYLSGHGVFSERGRHPFPDLVVLDLKLPRVSGLDVLRWIRAQPGLETLPVTILSSSGEPRDIESAYMAGANSYLVKTSDISKMSAVVNGLCAHARLHANASSAAGR